MGLAPGIPVTPWKRGIKKEATSLRPSRIRQKRYQMAYINMQSLLLVHMNNLPQTSFSFHVYFFPVLHVSVVCLSFLLTAQNSVLLFPASQYIKHCHLELPSRSDIAESAIKGIYIQRGKDFCSFLRFMPYWLIHFTERKGFLLFSALHAILTDTFHFREISLS